MNVLGLPQRLPAFQLWQGLIDALLRTAAPAANGGQGRNEDAVRVPEPPAAPAPSADQFHALDHVLRDMDVDGLLSREQNLVADPERDDSRSSTETCLALAFVAAGAYHARLRAQARSRSVLECPGRHGSEPT